MKTINFLLIIFLCCYCGNNNKVGNSIDVLSSPDGEIENLSTIATTIDYVPLQTNEKSLIKRISSIKAKGEFLYIKESNRILCFDSKGKHLIDLDKQGRGPEEYQFILDFDVNYNNSKLAVLSGKEILIYDQTSDGFNFDRKLQLGSSPWRINFTGESNNILLQYSNADGTRIFSNELINYDGTRLSAWLNYLKFTSVDGFITTNAYESSSYIQNNKLFLKELQNDTLFCLTDSMTLNKVLVFNTGEMRLTAEARSNGKHYFDNQYDYLTVPDIFSSERYLYYSFSYKKSGRGNKIIFDRESGKKFVIPKKEGLTDDISGGISFKPQYCYNGIFFSWVEANTLKNHVSGDAFKSSVVTNPEKKEELKRLADSITESDNPVLIMAKIR